VELETSADTVDETVLVAVAEIGLLLVTDIVADIDFDCDADMDVVDEPEELAVAEMETLEAEAETVTVIVCVISAVPVEDIVVLNVTLFDCVVDAVLEIDHVVDGVFVALDGMYPVLKRGLLSNPVIFATRKQFAVVKKLVKEYPVHCDVLKQRAPQLQSSNDTIV
jgi:hypothetical protein